MTIRFALVLLMTVATVPGATFYCDPVNGSMQGDGSPGRPWRTIEEVLQTRLIQLRDQNRKPANPTAPVKAGDTILLRSGWHGVIRIAGAYNVQFITIAAEQGHMPQVGWIEIGEGRKWRLRGLTVSPSLAPAPPERAPRHLVMLGERGGEESADLIVEDCFIYSVLDTTGWTGKDWVEKPASGIWLGRQGKGHVARNNLAHSFDFKADAEVKAENNREVTEAAFNQKLSALAASIGARFGHLHTAANRTRLEVEPAQD